MGLLVGVGCTDGLLVSPCVATVATMTYYDDAPAAVAAVTEIIALNCLSFVIERGMGSPLLLRSIMLSGVVVMQLLLHYCCCLSSPMTHHHKSS